MNTTVSAFPQPSPKMVLTVDPAVFIEGHQKQSPDVSVVKWEQPTWLPNSNPLPSVGFVDLGIKQTFNFLPEINITKIATGWAPQPGSFVPYQFRVVIKPWMPLPSEAGHVDPAFGPEAKFRRLADQWRDETMDLSSLTDKVVHPAYLRIIGMGTDAAPFVLAELRDRGGWWFTALESIADINPIPPEVAGNIASMTDIWLRWGASKGYL